MFPSMMREMIATMMRFSGTATMFGVQQMQNAISAPADSRAALTRLRQTLDAMSDTLVSKLNPGQKAIFESMSRSQADIFGLGLETMDLENAGEFMRKTSEALADIVSRTSHGKAGGAA